MINFFCFIKNTALNQNFFLLINLNYLIFFKKIWFVYKFKIYKNHNIQKRSKYLNIFNSSLMYTIKTSNFFLKYKFYYTSSNYNLNINNSIYILNYIKIYNFKNLLPEQVFNFFFLNFFVFRIFYFYFLKFKLIYKILIKNKTLNSTSNLIIIKKNYIKNLLFLNSYVI